MHLPEVTRERTLALLLARHEQAVKAARLQAVAPHGTAASRKRHVAWQAAEAAFAASVAEFDGERISQTELKRIASPDDPRQALYLSSDTTSVQTGTAMLLDGGLSITRT